jgi:hypothetical protein
MRLLWFSLILMGTGFQCSVAQSPLTAVTNNLYDTGWSSAGIFNANSNMADGHYFLNRIVPNMYPPQVTSLPAPAYGVTNAEVTSAGWSQPNSTSGTINSSGQTVGATWDSFSSTSISQPNTLNIFVYQLNLTNIPVGASVTITGLFGADDSLGVFVDGQGTAQVTNNNYGTAVAGTITFTATGADYLQFLVLNLSNSGGNTGLYVNDLAGYYTVVPEPRTWSMAVLVGLGVLVTHRKLGGKRDQARLGIA